MASHWNRRFALAGAALWAALAFAGRHSHLPFGPIELLLLLAVLVVVPLALALLQQQSPAYLTSHSAAIFLQPIAAAFAVISLFHAPGAPAALRALPWLAFAAVMAFQGWGPARSRPSLSRTAFQIARLNLLIASVWLVASRLGLRPLDTQEPIVLLTAVHFHYTGFATAILAGTAFASQETLARKSRWYLISVAIILSAPYLIAAGFVFSPCLKVAGVAALSLALVTFAAVQFAHTRQFLNPAARRFVRASCALIFLGMALALTYSLGEFLHRDWLTIPRMASTHGLINGVGFVLSGLLGWLIETQERASLRFLAADASRIPLPALPSAAFHDCIRR
jgi:hypothetical protein